MLTCLIVSLLFFLLGPVKIGDIFSTKNRDKRYISLVSDITELIKNYYVEDIDPEAKFSGAYTALLTAADPMAAYLNPEQSQDYLLYNKGILYGSGIHGYKRNQYFQVTDIMPGSPAEREGIRRGDTISGINGESLFRNSYWETVLKLNTRQQTQIQVYFKRPGDDNQQRISLTTEPIKISKVVNRLHGDTILLRLQQIDLKAVESIQELIEKSTGSELQLILDLRNYSGGEWKAFQELTRCLLPTSRVLSLRFKKGDEDITLGTDQAISFKGIAIIDKSTIMYNELLAALLKTIDIPIIGQRTQGFSSLLQQFMLDDGSSILLSSAIFLINGQSLTGEGISPDINSDGMGPDEVLKRCLQYLNEDQ